MEPYVPDGMQVIYVKRQAVSQNAEVKRLSAFRYLSMIDKYAKAFSMPPDVVYKEKFDTVISFLILWKEESEYMDRYTEYSKSNE